MTKVREFLQERLAYTLWAVIIGILSALGSLLYKDFFVPFLEKVVPSIPPRSLFAIASIELVLLLMALISFMLLHNKKRKYRFDKVHGIWRHKKTGEAFCPSCLANNIESPLQESKAGWWCGIKTCEKFYRNPDDCQTS